MQEDSVKSLVHTAIMDMALCGGENMLYFQSSEEQRTGETSVQTAHLIVHLFKRVSNAKNTPAFSLTYIKNAFGIVIDEDVQKALDYIVEISEGDLSSDAAEVLATKAAFHICGEGIFTKTEGQLLHAEVDQFLKEL